jgi:hypothetical protein
MLTAVVGTTGQAVARYIPARATALAATALLDAEAR